MPISPIDEIKSRLDIVEVIGSYIKLEKAGANYRAICPFHSEKKPSFFVSPARQIWHCFGCFLPETLVKTERGFHPIKDIQHGQKVLTHKARYMPALQTLRSYKGEIIDLKVRKSSQIVSLTPDHEVFVIKTKHCPYRSRRTRICQRNCKKEYCPQFYKNYKIEKLPVLELSKDDFLLYPVNQEIKDVEFIDLDKYYNRKISNYGPKIKGVPSKIRVDEKFLKLIGYYIAEGSNHRAYIRFSLGNHERKFAMEIKNLIKEIFGISAGIHLRRKGSKGGIEVSACNSKLSNIFENLCGSHAENKHIPFEFQYLPFKKQRVILDAIWKGDGTIAEVSKCKNKRYRKSISTTSLILAEQLRDILLREHIAPGFYIEDERTDKRGVHHRKNFMIDWQENYTLQFTHFYKDPRTNVLYWASPIKEIKRRHYKGDVYNLTVARDHSYVATNFVVGNCGAGGDIFKFVMMIEGVEFGDALRILAKRAGVELKKQPPELKTERQRLYKICDLASKFFEKQLIASRAGKEAKKYLLNRGINEHSLKKWQIGYAPDIWQGLSDFLVSKGYSREEIVKAGLAVKKEAPDTQYSTPNIQSYDRFRGRIIFPVFDLNSQVIGFGARAFVKKEEIAKYVNTPNTLLYDKSRVLYGLDKAKVEIRRKDSCLLVEGYIDAILNHQAGYENTVAVSGTALTPYQLRILKRYTNNLILAFDMDLAGESATKKGIDLAQSEGFNIKVVTMPEGKDPSDIISENPKNWEMLVKSAKSILDFYFETAFSEFDKETPEGKREISKILLPVIKRIPNKIEQSSWVQKLSDMLEVREEAITDELSKIHSTTLRDKIGKEISLEEPEEKKKTRKEFLEERVVTLLLKSPDNLNYISEQDLDFFSPKISQIILHLKDKKKIPTDLSDFFNYLSLKSEVEEEEIDAPKEIENCLIQLRSIGIKNKLNKLSLEIKAAEQKEDFKKADNLAQQFNQLTKKLADLENEKK